jgi:hypothetical protein
VAARQRAVCGFILSKLERVCGEPIIRDHDKTPRLINSALSPMCCNNVSTDFIFTPFYLHLRQNSITIRDYLRITTSVSSLPCFLNRVTVFGSDHEFDEIYNDDLPYPTYFFLRPSPSLLHALEGPSNT